MNSGLIKQLVAVASARAERPWSSGRVDLGHARALVPGLVDDPWGFFAARGARLRVLGGSLPGEERVFCAPELGARWLERGHTLYWMTAEVGVPELRDALEGLGEEWGFTGGHAGIFVSPPRAVSTWHFDVLHNLNVQLQGCKRWRMGEHPRMNHPAGNYGIGEHVPPSLEYCREQLEALEGIEADAEIEISEGEVVHVPAGCWHEVHSAGAPSISLSLGMRSPSRKDVLVEVLRSVLDRSEFWREPTDRSPEALCEALREWLTPRPNPET